MGHTYELHPKSLAWAFGSLAAAGMFFLGILNWSFGWWPTWTMLMGEGYVGFGPSVLGVLLGTVWGFVDGFVGGYIVAWVYNYFVKKNA